MVDEDIWDMGESMGCGLIFSFARRFWPPPVLASPFLFSPKRNLNHMTAQYWIDQLDLQAHPEGGYFAEVYRSREQIPAEALPARYQGPRNFGTSIYFLLKGDGFSAFHRIRSDEGWHYYTGNSPIWLYVIAPDGALTEHVLGPEVAEGQTFQAMVPAQHWFAAQVAQEEDAYGLVGCTVQPGFDFADFELADRQTLTALFPAHRDLIARLTRLSA